MIYVQKIPNRIKDLKFMKEITKEFYERFTYGSPNLPKIAKDDFFQYSVKNENVVIKREDLMFDFSVKTNVNIKYRKKNTTEINSKNIDVVASFFLLQYLDNGKIKFKIENPHKKYFFSNDLMKRKSEFVSLSYDEFINTSLEQFAEAKRFLKDNTKLFSKLVSCAKRTLKNKNKYVKNFDFHNDEIVEIDYENFTIKDFDIFLYHSYFILVDGLYGYSLSILPDCEHDKFNHWICDYTNGYSVDRVVEMEIQNLIEGVDFAYLKKKKYLN